MDNRRPSTLPPPRPLSTMSKSSYLKMISESSTPPVNDLLDVKDIVRTYKEKIAKNFALNRPQKAAEVQNQMFAFSKQAQKALFKNRCQTAINDYRSRLSETHCDFEQFQEDDQIDETQWKISIEERISAMKARHEKELQQHEAAKPVETPALFKRRSPQLLELMRQERRLLFQGRFEEASIIRKEIDEQEANECKAAHGSAMQSWEKKGEHLKEKHHREEQAMNEWVTARKAERKIDTSTQMTSIQKREKLLNGEIKKRDTIMRHSLPHAVRRSLQFDKTVTRGITPPLDNIFDIDKLCLSLPSRSRKILMDL